MNYLAVQRESGSAQREDGHAVHIEVITPTKKSGRIFKSISNFFSRPNDRQEAAIKKTINLVKSTLEGLDQTMLRLYWFDCTVRDTGEQVTAICFPSSSIPIPINDRIVEVAGETWFSDLKESMHPKFAVKKKNHMVVNPSNSYYNHAVYQTTTREELPGTYSPLQMTEFTGSKFAYTKAKLDFGGLNCKRVIVARKDWDTSLASTIWSERIKDGLLECNRTVEDFDMALNVERAEVQELRKLSASEIESAENLAKCVRMALSKLRPLSDYHELLITLEKKDEDGELDLIQCLARQVVAEEEEEVSFTEWNASKISKLKV